MRSKMDNYMKLEIPGRSQNESFARVAVAAFASQLDPTLEELSDIKTVVSEAVTNAIIHGYVNEIGKIIIKARLRENNLEIEIIDFGIGIEDIEKAREPLYTTKPELERSGMGFTIIDKFMDQVEIASESSKGTTVKMVKNIEKRNNTSN